MVVFDKNEEQIVATLKGHTKKVTSVIYHPSQVSYRSRVISLRVKTYLSHAQPINIRKHCLSYFPSPPSVFLPSSLWSSPHLQTPPFVCGPSPEATVFRWCAPMRQVSLDSPYMLLETICSAPLRIRWVHSFEKLISNLPA